jgi:hypothetical protein
MASAMVAADSGFWPCCSSTIPIIEAKRFATASSAGPCARITASTSTSEAELRLQLLVLDEAEHLPALAGGGDLPQQRFEVGLEVTAEGRLHRGARLAQDAHRVERRRSGVRAVLLRQVEQPVVGLAQHFESVFCR